MIIWDIETGPLDEEIVLSMVDPFVGKPHPGIFDESKVKFGNIKDLSLKKAKVEEQRAKHDVAVTEWEAETGRAKEAWRLNALDRAALDATTGMVLAIGYMGLSGEHFATTKTRIDGVHPSLARTEPDVLSDFWIMWDKCHAAKRPMIGHNILGFDYPFLIRRSFIHGVLVPAAALDSYVLRNVAVDTMRIWLCGAPMGSTKASLDHVARALGAGAKNGSGADFHRLWRSDEHADFVAAKEYLANDLSMIERVARKMGILPKLPPPPLSDKE